MARLVLQVSLNFDKGGGLSPKSKVNFAFGFLNIPKGEGGGGSPIKDIVLKKTIF